MPVCKNKEKAQKFFKNEEPMSSKSRNDKALKPPYLCLILVIQTLTHLGMFIADFLAARCLE